MKIYKVFTASLTEEMARLHCAQYYPFGARWIGFMGYYQERGWWMVAPREPYVPGQEICVDIGDPELVLYSVDRNVSCIDGVGDLVEWGYVDDLQHIWSNSKYLGLAFRVSKQCFVLPGK